MLKIDLKKLLINFTIISLIFLIDRFSKIYILRLADVSNLLDIYINPYLNFYLIWNKGIAFGLFSFDDNFVYNLISLIISVITIIILIMIIKSNGFKKYSLIFIFGGSISNIFDRLYFAAVPDFIDFHINDFHWFIFNVADIFISIGVICLILDEIYNNKRRSNETI